MGGISLGGGSIKGHGSVDSGKAGGRKRSFYQVHYYVYPVVYWLEILTDFVCLEKGKFDVAYITEFDPMWNDDETAFFLNPEAAIFQLLHENCSYIYSHRPDPQSSHNCIGLR